MAAQVASCFTSLLPTMVIYCFWCNIVLLSAALVKVLLCVYVWPECGSGALVLATVMFCDCSLGNIWQLALFTLA